MTNWVGSRRPANGSYPGVPVQNRTVAFRLVVRVEDEKPNCPQLGARNWPLSGREGALLLCGFCLQPERW